MARTDAGNVLTAEHRRAQLAVRANALRDFIRLWPLWRGDDQTFQSLVAATLPLIRAHHGVSSSLGLAYFEAFRRAERVAGSARPVIAPAVDVEKVVASLVVTGRIQTRKAIAAGQSPQAAMQTALVRVGGSVTRQVLKGGRDALVLSSGEDPRAQGWTRITDGNACDFCTGLAGQVFRGESAAEFEAHDHCGCGAEPSF